MRPRRPGWRRPGRAATVRRRSNRIGEIMVQATSGEPGERRRPLQTMPGETDGLDFYTAGFPSRTASPGSPIRRSSAGAGGWVLGLSDIVRSTSAIEAGRYKTVNTAAAAVIAAVANALGGRRLPVRVRGRRRELRAAARAGGARPPDACGRRRLGARRARLDLRVALVPVEAVRAAASTSASPASRPRRMSPMRCSRAAASPARSEQMKAGAFAVAPAPARHAARPDGPVVPLRRDPGRARRHPVAHRRCRRAAATRPLSGLRRGDPGARRGRRRGGRPVPAGGPPVRWPPPGFARRGEATREPAGRASPPASRWGCARSPPT